MTAMEINFDSIVGPTHHYAGLAVGNLASQHNRNLVSNPREAALQGLAKMKRLLDLGIPQAVLPPHPRPHLSLLRAAGFSGTDSALLAAAAHTAPTLLSACYSASAMWAANAATVSPSADAADARAHFTPANLISHLHRAIEAPYTGQLLRAIFNNPTHFAHHDPLPAALELSDEGAANHTRLSPQHGDPGIQIFVYGRDAGDKPDPDQRYLPRQAAAASHAIARLHQLQPDRTLFLRQNPAAIAAGVFHNDVIAVGHENVFLCHEKAFTDPAAPSHIADLYARLTGTPLHLCIVPESILPLAAAVKSYLFNSQLLTAADGSLFLLAPADCQDIPAAKNAADFILSANTPIKKMEYIDVRQSMRNGGGPACLRLRVVLTPEQRAAAHPGVFLTHPLHHQLQECIRSHYRDHLSPSDLADPQLPDESLRAHAALMSVLQLSIPP